MAADHVGKFVHCLILAQGQFDVRHFLLKPWMSQRLFETASACFAGAGLSSGVPTLH